MPSLALSILITVAVAFYLSKSLRLHKPFLSYKNRKLTFPAQVKGISFKAAFVEKPRLELGLSWGFVNASFCKTKAYVGLFKPFSLSPSEKKEYSRELNSRGSGHGLQFHPSKWNQNSKERNTPGKTVVNLRSNSCFYLGPIFFYKGEVGGIELEVQFHILIRWRQGEK